MVTDELTGFGMGRALGGGEDVLPCPFSTGVGVLAIQSGGQRGAAIPLAQVVVVDIFDMLQMFLQERQEGLREYGHPILAAFAIPHDDLALLEVDVLDAQAEAFHQPQAAAVEQFGHQPLCAREEPDHAPDLIAGQDDGQAPGLLGPHGVDGFRIQVLPEHLAVEKEEGVQGLVLGRGRHVPIYGQVREKLLDLGGAHLARVAFVVKEDEAPDPTDVGLFGAGRVVLDSDGLTDAVEQFLLFAHGFAPA